MAARLLELLEEVPPLVGAHGRGAVEPLLPHPGRDGLPEVLVGLGGVEVGVHLPAQRDEAEGLVLDPRLRALLGAAAAARRRRAGGGVVPPSSPLLSGRSSGGWAAAATARRGAWPRRAGRGSGSGTVREGEAGDGGGDRSGGGSSGGAETGRTGGTRGRCGGRSARPGPSSRPWPAWTSGSGPSKCTSFNFTNGP